MVELGFNKDVTQTDHVRNIYLSMLDLNLYLNVRSYSDLAPQKVAATTCLPDRCTASPPSQTTGETIPVQPLMTVG